MPKLYFSTEDGMCAVPGTGEESPQQKSWIEMVKDGTYDEYAAKRIAEAKAERGENPEAQTIMDSALLVAEEKQTEAPSRDEDDGLEIAQLNVPSMSL